MSDVLKVRIQRIECLPAQSTNQLHIQHFVNHFYTSFSKFLQQSFLGLYLVYIVSVFEIFSVSVSIRVLLIAIPTSSCAVHAQGYMLQ